MTRRARPPALDWFAATNSGRQQIDFHAGFGFNRESPKSYLGLSYSFRFDGLFGGRAPSALPTIFWSCIR
jgi:hypothetical protein